jgi:alpha-ribazole phosphatase
MTTTTRWWWVRHAPVPNMTGIMYGSDDVVCDTDDRGSFDQLASVLPADAHWMTSHLSRTHHTADAIRAAGLDFPTPVVEEGLGEQNFGDWQGRNWNDMEKADPDVYKTFWLDPARNRPPNGESFEDLINRTSVIINRVNEERRGQTIVAVAHGGTIRAAISHALGLSPEAGMSFATDNLSMTCLEHVEGGLLRGKGEAWRVVCINRPAK